MLLNIPGSIVPEQEIITFENSRQNYSQLIQNVGRLAAVFESNGIAKGDRIGLISTNRPEMIEAFFAAFQLGAVIVPINYRAKADELAYMIEDSGVKVLILEHRYADLVAPILNERKINLTICIDQKHEIGSYYKDIISSISKPLTKFVEVEDSDLAILMYTSGTTSRPKGVMITHGQLTSYVMNHTEAADGTPRGSSLVSVPGYHIAGATSIFNSIYGGRRLVLLSQFDAGKWLKLVESEKVTHAFLVPTMLKRLMDHPDFEKVDLSSLENLSYGAAPMPLPVIRRAIEKFPSTTNFANGFGMTETTSTVTVLGPEDHRLEGSPEEIEKKIERLSSVGKPLPGVEIKILDDDGNPVGVNTVGNIYVRTGRAMKGYWKRPDASKETLVDGWVNTQDRGWLDEDGYLFLEGRSSDLIIRGGENISPAEIENVLLEHPKVDDVAVLGIPSLEWGEEVMAVVVPNELEQPPTFEELTEFCRERLASFKRPTRIEFVRELPRTSTGKVLKRDLREQFAVKESE